MKPSPPTSWSPLCSPRRPPRSSPPTILGIASLEARRLKDAEQHFRAAIDGGQRTVERDGMQVPWGITENTETLSCWSEWLEP